MLTRRLFVLATVLLATAGPVLAAPPTPNDPVAILNAIYTRVAQGKGDAGGGFVTDKPGRAKYLSKALAELWAKAEAKTPKDDVGPIDFDPVTNSQEPDVKSFTAVAEQTAADSAVVAVTLTPRQTPRAKPVDNILHYAFVRDGGHWKIDDIKGSSDGEPWSIRAMLTDSLKH